MNFTWSVKEFSIIFPSFAIILRKWLGFSSRPQVLLQILIWNFERPKFDTLRCHKNSVEASLDLEQIWVSTMTHYKYAQVKLHDSYLIGKSFMVFNFVTILRKSRIFLLFHESDSKFWFGIINDRNLIRWDAIEILWKWVLT